MEEEQHDPKSFDAKLIMETLAAHNYEYERPLGHGGFASVHLVKSRRYNMTFCVKVSVRPADLDADGKSGEVETLFTLTAPCIIRMYEYFADSNYLYIVLEYCSGGSLDDVIKKGGRLTGDRLLQICRESAFALKACHDLRVAHRDIKPANLLLDQYDRLKLADFGLSQALGVGHLIRERAGSRPYMAPEILLKQPYDPFKADVWALGVTWYVLMMGKLPWATGSQRELELAISMGMVDFGRVKHNQAIGKMIRKMLTVDAKKRPDIDWVVQQEVLKPQAHPSRSDTAINRRNAAGPGLGLGRSPSMIMMMRSPSSDDLAQRGGIQASSSHRKLQLWQALGSKHTQSSYKLSAPLETFVE